jgi:hypothetical protein
MKKLLALGIILLASNASADYLRTRDDLGKSSFSAVSTIHVALSTAPSILRSITFSGVDPATVTIYNAQLNGPGGISTRTVVAWPGGLNVPPSTVRVNVNNSSGTIIDKVGTALTQYDWDWYTRPVYSNPLNNGN